MEKPPFARFLFSVFTEESEIDMSQEDAVTEAANAAEKTFRDALPEGFTLKVEE